MYATTPGLYSARGSRALRMLGRPSSNGATSSGPGLSYLSSSAFKLHSADSGPGGWRQRAVPSLEGPKAVVAGRRTH